MSVRTVPVGRVSSIPYSLRSFRYSAEPVSVVGRPSSPTFFSLIHLSETRYLTSVFALPFAVS